MTTIYQLTTTEKRTPTCALSFCNLSMLSQKGHILPPKKGVSWQRDCAAKLCTARTKMYTVHPNTKDETSLFIPGLLVSLETAVCFSYACSCLINASNETCLSINTTQDNKKFYWWMKPEEFTFEGQHWTSDFVNHLSPAKTFSSDLALSEIKLVLQKSNVFCDKTKRAELSLLLASIPLMKTVIHGFTFHSPLFIPKQCCSCKSN